MATSKTRIVIVGGGIGGLFTALELAGEGEVTLVTDEDHFLFTPMLYEYLSGEVEEWHIAPKYSELLDARVKCIAWPGFSSRFTVPTDQAEWVCRKQFHTTFSCLLLAELRTTSESRERKNLRFPFARLLMPTCYGSEWWTPSIMSRQVCHRRTRGAHSLSPLWERVRAVSNFQPRWLTCCGMPLNDEH